MLAQLGSTLSGPPAPPPPPEPPPTLGWDEAMRQATETLNPIYDERMQQTLGNVDKELIQRGFFGQLPGAALAGSRAADVERAKAAAIASLGGQMQSQSQDQALAQQRLAAEWAMNQSALWNQTQSQKMNTLLGSMDYMTGLRELYPTWWSSLYGKQPDMTDVSQIVSSGWATAPPTQQLPANNLAQQPLRLDPWRM